MNRTAGAGRIVILNGGSSAGKTTIGRGFQAARAARGEPWLITGLDAFHEMMPAAYIGEARFVGAHADDGYQFVSGEQGLRLRAGPFARRVHAAYHRTVAVWARNGFDLIVDEVAFDAETAADWRDALTGRPVLWVGVRCPADVARAREAERGDRNIGLAEGFAELVHEHVVYDVDVDTARMSTEQCVAIIDAAVDEFEPFADAAAD